MAQEAAVLQPIPFPLYNWAGFHQVNSMLQPGRWISSATQATARKGSIAVRKEAGTLCGASWSGSSSGLRPPPHRGHPHLLGSLTPTAGTAAVCGRRRPRIRVPHLGVRGSGRAAAFVATAAARPDRRRSVPGQAAGGGGHGRWRRCRGGWRVGSERGRAEQRWRAR
uniref:Uncharacterized protein n=1 Tax=Aegilops tauschii subsp. strangulata TaxID=200361 RepID=A0A453L5L8_AEGTS